MLNQNWTFDYMCNPIVMGKLDATIYLLQLLLLPIYIVRDLSIMVLSFLSHRGPLRP